MGKDLRRSRICSAGRTCLFTADVTMNVEDQADLVGGGEKDGKSNFKIVVDFEVTSTCGGPADSEWNYFQLSVTDVLGGISTATERMKKFPAFFLQDKFTGEIKSVYTSSDDPKPAAMIKRGLISSLAKQVSKGAIERVRAEAKSAAVSDVQLSPVTYSFSGEDHSGEFTAYHEVSLDSDGGVTLLETKKYHARSAEDVENAGYGGQSLDMKMRGKTAMKLDDAGRVTKMKTQDRAVIGNIATPSVTPVIAAPDMGKATFQMEFDVIRVSKEDNSAPCPHAKSQADIETDIQSRLGGAYIRPLDKRYTLEEMTYDPLDEVDSADLTAQAKILLDRGDFTIEELQKVMRRKNVEPVLDIAWDKYQQDAISDKDIHTVVATLGTIHNGPAYEELLNLARAAHMGPALRSQALMALAPIHGDASVPSFVLDGVNDIAFSEDDELADDAALLLGAFCDGHPLAEKHVYALQNQMQDANPLRRKVLTAALHNARVATQAFAFIEEDEEFADDEEMRRARIAKSMAESEVAESGIADLELGEGSKTFLDKQFKLQGGDIFYTGANINANAKWGFESAVIQASATVDAKVLDFGKKIFGASASAKAQGSTVSAEYSFDVLEKTLKSGSKSYTSKYLQYGGNCPTQLSDAPVATEQSWQKQLASFSARFTLGPVPLKVSVSISGTVGYKIHAGGWFNCNNGKGGDIALMGGAAPSGSILVSADAAVDAFVARAGVEGKITILEGNVPAYGSVTTSSGCGKVDLYVAGGKSDLVIFAEVGVKKSEEEEEDLDEGSSALLKWKAWDYVKEKASNAYDAVKEKANKLAESLYKRWDKTILSWDGKSKQMNIYSQCTSLNLGKFLKKDGESAADANKSSTASSSDASSEKPPASSSSATPEIKKAEAEKAKAEAEIKKNEAAAKEAEASKKLAETETKRAAANTEQIQKDAVRAEDAVVNSGQRGRDVTRSQGEQSRDQVRKDADQVKEIASTNAKDTQAAVQKEGKSQRDTARSEERSTVDSVKSQGEQDRKEIRRNSEKLEKAQKSTRSEIRREAKNEEDKVESLQKKQSNERMTNLIRREKTREVAANDKLKDLIRRDQERKRFSKERDVARKNEAKLTKKIRRDEKEKFEESEFKSLRSLERRDFGKMKKDAEFKTLKNTIRRRSDEKKSERRDFEKVEKQIRRKEESGKERRRLDRMSQRVEKDVSQSADIKGKLKGLEKNFKETEKSVTKAVRRTGKSLDGKLRRESKKEDDQRRAKKIRQTIRRDEKKKVEKKGIASLRNALKAGMKSMQSLQKRVQKGLKKAFSKVGSATERRAQFSKLLKKVRTDASRVLKATQRASKSLKKNLTQSAEAKKLQKQFSTFGKHIKKFNSNLKSGAQRLTKNLRATAKDGLKDIKNMGARIKRGAKRSAKEMESSLKAFASDTKDNMADLKSGIKSALA